MFEAALTVPVCTVFTLPLAAVFHFDFEAFEEKRLPGWFRILGTRLRHTKAFLIVTVPVLIALVTALMILPPFSSSIPSRLYIMHRQRAGENASQIVLALIFPHGLKELRADLGAAEIIGEECDISDGTWSLASGKGICVNAHVPPAITAARLAVSSVPLSGDRLQVAVSISPATETARIIIFFPWVPSDVHWSGISNALPLKSKTLRIAFGDSLMANYTLTFSCRSCSGDRVRVHTLSTAESTAFRRVRHALPQWVVPFSGLPSVAPSSIWDGFTIP
jgi:hypothetical protein